MTTPPWPPPPGPPPPVPQMSPAEAGFQHMMNRLAEAARRISGAENSHWNGRWFASNDGGLGAAHWTRELSFDGDRVLRPLHEMWQRYGQQHDPATLQLYREALQTLLHENSHMLSRAGEQRVDSAQVAADPSVSALEEGVSEEWSRQHVNAYIHELDLERVAPGISGTVDRDAYPNYTPAVNAMCDGLAQNAGTTRDQVLTRLNNLSAKDKWPEVAEMVMESSGLNDQIPEAQRAAARDRIQHAMQSQFANLPQPDRSQPMTPQAWQSMQLASAAAGQNAISQATVTVNQLRAEYPLQPTLPSHEQQATTERGVPGDPHAQAPQGLQGQSGPGHFTQWEPTPENRPPTGITPDMRRAMELTSAGVHRMDVIRPEATREAGDQSSSAPAHAGAHRKTGNHQQGPPAGPRPDRSGRGE